MPINKKSILNTIKVPLNVSADDTDFDEELVTHINSAFFELYQLGVGPKNRAYEIEDATQVWDDFFGPIPNLNAVKTYIYMWVRQIYDPPPTSYAVESYTRQMEQLQWRLKEEASTWVEPAIIFARTESAPPEMKIYKTGAADG